MIKRWNSFINESKSVPGPGEQGSVRINIGDDEIEFFSSEPALQNLIANQKASLLGNEVWVFDHDEETMNILRSYLNNFEITNESTELPTKSQINENVETNDESIGNHESLICPYCKCEQAEHPENIFHDDFATYDCDECGKEFECSKVVEVTYYTRKIK